MKYNKRNLNLIISKRYKILFVLIILFFVYVMANLFYIQIINKKYYLDYIERNTNSIVEGEYAPRGKIYDRNKRVIVDNKIVKIITYKYKKSDKSMTDIAYSLSSLIKLDITNVKDNIYKDFYMLIHKEEVLKKIKEKEWNNLKERKITDEDITNLKRSRISIDEINSMSDKDKLASYIYYLMNNGYSYEKKIIKEEVDEEEYATVASTLDNIPGVEVSITWKRVYPYGDTFKSILGTISNGLPKEEKSRYLNLGYSLDDKVGISGLEKQYEKYLQGVKNKYKINKDGSYSLYKKGRRGYDLVLSIDIELQKGINDILSEEVVSAMKSLPNGYYNKSYVVVSEPSTGEVLALSGVTGVNKNNEYKTYDYSVGIMVNPIVAGSIVKGASHIVGYNTGALKIGETRLDECIKLAATPLKCSWKLNLGYLDDITALKQSSNSYQYKTAMKVGKGNYFYNGPLTIDTNAFNIYRNTFAEFGLGVKTGIDFPIESDGYKGTGTASGYLLDFAIGQYDNYTTIELAQYISTIANKGVRVKPRFLKAIYEPNDKFDIVIKKIEPVVLNKIITKDIYIERVRQGFHAVCEYGGTGYGYIDSIYDPAAKTGTSESFIDTNNDGMVDTATQTNTFGAFVPYENPEVVFTVVSPDMGYYVGKTVYRNYVNKKIAQLVSKKYYEIFK